MQDQLDENLKQRLWGAQREGGAEEPAAPALASRLAQWVGGIVSLALVLGVVYWVFELGRRDANEVPVIQAMGGVARDLPEDVGGPQVDHQGLQVNEVLASDETAPVEPETRLAPPPQRVVPEDVAPATPVEPVAPPPAETPVTETATAPFVLPPSLPGADPNMTRPERRIATTGLPPAADLLSDAIANAISTVAAEESAAPQPVTAATPATMPAITVGEKMIQLGAYEDEESAIQDWNTIAENNQDLMGGLTQFVERREAGGRVFYRLRARGFDDMEAATNMCTALLARGVQCIAVTAR